MEPPALGSKETFFALSLFPYLGFLWFLGRSGKAPRLVVAGFWVLLLFVFITIPAGIYALQHYNQELANVDWLHGGAEFFLSLSNVLVVVGFSRAIVRLSIPNPDPSTETDRPES